MARRGYTSINQLREVEYPVQRRFVLHHPDLLLVDEIFDETGGIIAEIDGVAAAEDYADGVAVMAVEVDGGRTAM